MIGKIPTLLATLGATLLLGLALPPVGAEDQESDRAADRAAVRDRTQEFLKALAKGDAKELAAFWTATGEYARGSDLTIRGQANIEKAYAEHRKKKQPAPSPSRASRSVSCPMTRPCGKACSRSSGPTRPNRREVNLVPCSCAPGKWYFGLLRESPEATSLQELAWLVGSWTYGSDAAETRMVASRPQTSGRSR
jgi:hypothetical protein